MPDSAKNNRKKKGMVSMAMKSGEYEKMAQKASPPTKKLKNGISAFGIGGLICTLGEGLSILYEHLGISEEDTKLLVSASLILLVAILTACGVFDNIAYYAGAGTIVPITGFANSIVSPAMEFKSEGKILGTGANMFKIAGPVLVYGTLAAVIYGILYWIFTA